MQCEVIRDKSAVEEDRRRPEDGERRIQIQGSIIEKEGVMALKIEGEKLRGRVRRAGSFGV